MSYHLKYKNAFKHFSHRFKTRINSEANTEKLFSFIICSIRSDDGVVRFKSSLKNATGYRFWYKGQWVFIVVKSNKGIPVPVTVLNPTQKFRTRNGKLKPVDSKHNIHKKRNRKGRRKNG